LERYSKTCCSLMMLSNGTLIKDYWKMPLGLERLGDLKEKKLITDKEFSIAKKKLLNG